MSLIVKYYGLARLSDLTTATTGQGAYKLGDEVLVVDTTKSAVAKYKYINAATTALVAYSSYVIEQRGTAGAEVVTAAPATTTTASVEVCTPQIAISSGSYGFVLVQGHGKATIPTSTGVNAGFQLKLTNGATSLFGSSATLGYSAASCAAIVTSTTGVTGSVYLHGKKVTITT